MKKLFAISACCAILLIGCGGSDSTSTSSSSDNSAYVIDSPVKGIDYICYDGNGNVVKEGVTEDDGKLVYPSGTVKCKFGFKSSDGTKSGYVYETNISKDGNLYIFPIDDNPVAKSVPMILQTMDIDGNLSNGIQITQTEKDLYLDNFSDTIPTSTELESVMKQDENYSGQAVDEATAITNIFNDIKQYVKTGTYTGTFTLVAGDPSYCWESGTLSFDLNYTYDEDGNPYYKVINGSLQGYSASVGLDGVFLGSFKGSIVGPYYTTSLWGHVTTDQKIVGEYQNSYCRGVWTAVYSGE